MAMSTIIPPLQCSVFQSKHIAPHRYSLPQPQAAEQPLKPSAPPRRHYQRPQLVKGKSPQGSRVTVQMAKYLLCSATQLTSCSSPAAEASRLTSSMLSHATRPPRRKPTVETCVDNTAKLRPQASVLAPRPCTCNAQRAASRATARTPRPSTCVAPRHRHGHHDQPPLHCSVF